MLSLTDPDNTNVEIGAFVAKPGLSAMVQHLGTPASLEFGVNCILGVCVDSTTAFGDTGINVPIFTNNNDSIIVFSKNKFDVINILLDTISSQTITPEFYYSTGVVSGFQQFGPVDNTVGFTQNP